jgi:nucleotide-binding universal stress UspA family protein
VIAGIDDSPAAGPVLETAVAFAALVGAEVEALHVIEDGASATAAAAEAVGLPLRTAPGPVIERLIEAGEQADIEALALGARRAPVGGAPLGSTALAIATFVVPPDARRVRVLRRLLVPLEGGVSESLFPASIFELAEGQELDVIVLHVHDEASLPAFSDQPQHERPAWGREFLRRYCPWGIAEVALEVRVGRSEELVPLVAGEAGVDLIALGWAQELEPGRAPVVRAVLTQAHIPVMLVPVRVPPQAGPQTTASGAGLKAGFAAAEERRPGRRHIAPGR